MAAPSSGSVEPGRPYSHHAAAVIQRQPTNVTDHRRQPTEVTENRRQPTDINDHASRVTDVTDHRRQPTDVTHHRRQPTDVVSYRPHHARATSSVSTCVMTSQPLPLGAAKQAKPYSQIRPNYYVPVSLSQRVFADPEYENEEEILKPYLKTKSVAPRKWKTSLCKCGEDGDVCCLVILCLPCVECSISQKMGEGLCMPLFVPLATMALRVKLRTKYRIQGSIMSDCLATLFCRHCSVCQLKNEVDLIEKTRQEQWI